MEEYLKIYVYIYVCMNITEFLCCILETNIVNQLYFSKKIFFKLTLVTIFIF